MSPYPLILDLLQDQPVARVSYTLYAEAGAFQIDTPLGQLRIKWRNLRVYEAILESTDEHAGLGLTRAVVKSK